jgi:hypothetical protein
MASSQADVDTTLSSTLKGLTVKKVKIMRSKFSRSRQSPNLSNLKVVLQPTLHSTKLSSPTEITSKNKLTPAITRDIQLSSRLRSRLSPTL